MNTFSFMKDEDDARVPEAAPASVLNVRANQGTRPESSRPYRSPVPKVLRRTRKVEDSRADHGDGVGNTPGDTRDAVESRARKVARAFEAFLMECSRKDRDYHVPLEMMSCMAVGMATRSGTPHGPCCASANGHHRWTIQPISLDPKKTAMITIPSRYDYQEFSPVVAFGPEGKIVWPDRKTVMDHAPYLTPYFD